MKINPNAKVVLSEINYQADVTVRDFEFGIDVQSKKGGTDSNPTPLEYFLAGIGGCVSMTLRMYAEKMNWDLGEITVIVSEETKLTSKGIEKTIVEEISIEKEFSQEQQELLIETAAKCPVALMVKKETNIRRTLNK